MKKSVAIVGGGLAGLISAIELSTKGVPCILFERKKYPFHRVCGEYISNEALPYLKSRGLFPEHIQPPTIDTLILSSIRGRSATLPLDLGGFGMSRFLLDDFLAKKAADAGVKIFENTEVTGIRFSGNSFLIETSQGEFEASVAIAAHGKRSKLDVVLERSFLRKRSPYVGVKYHIRSTHPEKVISLHNFPGGYCGVVNVEGGKTNLCYLVRRDLVQEQKTIPALEQHVLSVNPMLKPYVDQIDRNTDRPVIINEISFATKSQIENHILMVGDAAGMITPLCGNGMAMAIRSAKLASDLVYEFCSDKITRQQLESRYSREWSSQFSTRMNLGRTVQQLFGSQVLSDVAVGMLAKIPPLATSIIKNTHGEVFH